MNITFLGGGDAARPAASIKLAPQLRILNLQSARANL
jgi:hypothetical protein